MNRRGHVDPYALAVRPMTAHAGVAPVVDLRATLPVAPPGDGTTDAWLDVVDHLRQAAGAAAANVTIKSFDRRRGAGPAELDAVLASLDGGSPVAFYGWWPTADAAATTEILGVDAMEVPPPDRKGRELADGHAVVIVGYGRHDAFPGGGYLIVRSGWSASGWGDGGDGYMPFTYVRAYATEMITMGNVNRGPGPDGGRPSPAPPMRVPAMEPRNELDADIDRQARCADPRASLTHLFFSDDLIELARARAICTVCPVREPCLRRALERQEPCGVWGGEIIVEGAVVAEKRGRGRPPKVPPPRLVVDEITGVPRVPIAV